MAIFQIGQRVRHRTRGVIGTVLELDGDTVYLEASNGVEMQFAAADLENNVPAPTPAKPAAEDPKYQTLLSRIPERVVGLAAVNFARDPATARHGWANATPREKLRWIGVATGLSFEQLTELALSGKARQIEAHASVALGKLTRR